jgi:hypothetical protein
MSVHFFATAAQGKAKLNAMHPVFGARISAGCRLLFPAPFFSFPTNRSANRLIYNATPVLPDNGLVNTPELSIAEGVAYTFDIGQWGTLTPRRSFSQTMSTGKRSSAAAI